MRILVLLLAFGFYTCDAQITTTKKQPASTTQTKPDFNVAVNFINSYVKFILSKNKKNPPLTTWIKTNASLTSTFKAKYQAMVDEAKKENPEMGLDFDPILDAQDLPEEGFVIKSTDPASGYFMLRGKDWKDFEITMKVVQKNGKWLVDGSGYLNIPDNKRAKR